MTKETILTSTPTPQNLTAEQQLREHCVQQVLNIRDCTGNRYTQVEDVVEQAELLYQYIKGVG